MNLEWDGTDKFLLGLFTYFVTISVGIIAFSLLIGATAM